MSQQANPRGTFLEIADVLKTQIETDPDMTELPSLAEVMRYHKVSRGLALRAFGVLRQEGVAEPVPGGGGASSARAHKSTGAHSKSGSRTSSRLTALEVGQPFPSASALADRFGVSRPTVTKALEKLKAAGVLAGGGQGKVRTVRAVPVREERS